MGCRCTGLLAIGTFVWLTMIMIPGTHQLQTSQIGVLLQIRKYLEYPQMLDIWGNYTGDLCNLSSSLQVTVTCQNNSVTELRIWGDKHTKAGIFSGYAVSGVTLSDRFPIDSFVTTITRLTTLRILSLVSLGIWGQLPDKIHRLYSLKSLDLSSNFLYGSVPSEMSRLVSLQSLKLDDNYFNSTVPDWLEPLSNLTVLSLKNNRFTGQFPSSICKITTLTNIALSHNQINGKLPDMSALVGLHILELLANHIDSELPTLPKRLVTILLSNNSLSGKIPEQLAELSELQHLDLSYNFLRGTPPSALFSLPKISYLNLASNMLSGSLSEHVTCGGELGVVNISANKLIGDLPSCLEATSSERLVSFDGNCLSIDSGNQHPESYCKDSHASRWRLSSKEIGIIVIIIVGTAILLLLLVCGIILWRRRSHPRSTNEQHALPKVIQESTPTGVSAEILANARLIAQATKLESQGTPAYKLFALEDLRDGTNNFDQSRLLGVGSFGKIYKGRLENGSQVAIRTMSFSKKYSVQNLKLKLDMLSRLHHPNLVNLLGHCIDTASQDDSFVNRVFLVYEYVPNGNFRTRLSESFPEKGLKWPDRLAILIGVAKAVHFLHTGVIPGTFKNRLTTHNILLDEHQMAKLSDYGMSIFREETDKRVVKGEGPISRQLMGLEDDVYNFGFILLEALVGPVVTGKGEGFLLNEMTSFGSQDGRKRIVDPVVLISSSEESLSTIVSITRKCISPETSARPSFEDVLWHLQYAAQVQATADADQRSDSTTHS